MAQRRPIASHPAFVPLIAIWFAALFGLGVAVLPLPLLSSLLAQTGVTGLVPQPGLARLAASLVAAIMGGALGFLVARSLAQRARPDPRPVYTEAEPVIADIATPAMRPLRIREEVEEQIQAGGDSEGEAFDELPVDPDAQGIPPPEGKRPIPVGEADEGFMILTPQPSHPSRPDADLEGLIEQFDRAIAAFRSDGSPRPEENRGPDPVHAFVARQTGSPAPSALGGRVPDHQAELRAALEKLARAHRVED